MAKNRNLVKMLHTDVPEFLPMGMNELNSLGYGGVDFVLVTGDAYVDHPSFGAALLGKLLWAAGYSVGIIAQPDVNNPESFKVFGAPALAFLVTSGNVDSMVNNYTAAKKPRSDDYYSPKYIGCTGGPPLGGPPPPPPKGGGNKRPDRALIVYSRKIRELFGDDVTIILGGLEASLRRFSHYDYWCNAVRKPVIFDAQADLLIYGMAERTLLEVAALLAKGASEVVGLCSVVSKTADVSKVDAVRLSPHEVVAKDRHAYAAAFKTQLEQEDKTLVQQCGKLFAVCGPPAPPLTTAEMDAVYDLRFARAAHPSYAEKGQEIPALQEVRFSITAVRGCFGACNFCSLAFHQRRAVVWRSLGSIVREAEIIAQMPDFKGYIHDVGGPTANFYGAACRRGDSSGLSRLKIAAKAACRKKCLFPEPCKNLNTSHAAFLDVLRAVRAVKGVKKAFVRSGIRFDHLLADPSPAFLNELCEHHISGQLKIAPEHVSDSVLRAMGKPKKAIYERFVEKYNKTNQRLGKKQFIVPYLMSGHPGSGLKEAVELAEYLRDHRISPEQVQDFYPTPGTVSTCMYHTGLNPLTGERVSTARTPKEKAMQRALIQYKLPQNHSLVNDALRHAGRTDLIGHAKKCLIRPKKE